MTLQITSAAAVLCFASMLCHDRGSNSALQHYDIQSISAIAAVLCFESVLHCPRGLHTALHHPMTPDMVVTKHQCCCSCAVLCLESVLHCHRGLHPALHHPVAPDMIALAAMLCPAFTLWRGFWTLPCSAQCYNVSVLLQLCCALGPCCKWIGSRKLQGHAAWSWLPTRGVL